MGHFVPRLKRSLQGSINIAGNPTGVMPAQITDKADSKVGFLHFKAIIAKKLEVGEGLS